MAEVEGWWLPAVGIYLILVGMCSRSQNTTLNAYYCFSGSLGSTLNFLVLMMYQKFKSLGSPTFLLLTNLAFCDLGLILSNTPFAAAASLNNK